jgi:outer membrane receptor protein involved in Fe transport
MQSIILPSLSYIKLSDGLPNPQERAYKVNFTARYSIQRGLFKGLFFGSNYGWRSKSILGYASRPVAANEVFRQFAGIGAGGYDVPDFGNPINGRPLTSIDGFLGYKRKILKGKHDWTLQLNVRNLFDDDELLEQRAYGRKQSDGSTRFWITNYNVPDPRRFTLTNTITF